MKRACLLLLSALALIAPAVRGAVQLVGVDRARLAGVQAVVDEQLRLEPNATPDAPLADDLAFFVSSYYRKAGFAEASVDWSLGGTGIVLTVTEGPRHTVGTVTFTGTGPFPEPLLRDHLLSPSVERHGAWTQPLPFVRGDVDAGVAQVERYCQSEGCLAARATKVDFTPGRRPGERDVRVTLDLGPRSVFGVLTLDGPAPDEAVVLRELAAPVLREPFSEMRLDALRLQMEDWYHARGHFLALVTARAVPNPARGGAVPVTLTVVPGPVFEVEEVVVDPALSRGAARVARSLLAPLRGSVYRPAQLDLRQRQVLDTGLFTRLDVDPQPTGPDRLRLKVSGEEGPPRSFGVYGGYETSEGPILGLEFRNVNFLRRGDSLRLNAEQSGAGWNAAAQWTNPAFLGRANSLDAQLFGFARERPGYHEQTFGLRTSLNRRPNPHLTLGVFSTLSTHAVDTVGLAPAELGPTHYRLVSVGGLVTLDHRNSPVSPTRGWFASGLLESGLGAGAGSVAYLKTDLGAAWYHTFSPRWRVAVGARWGLIQSRDGVDGLPADLRFYNGGANTVRSFAFQHLGPVNAAGVPLGGLGYDVISAELSRTLVENLELAVFGDAGSLSREGGVLQILPGDPRYALGLGLRYRLPVGPIRVDYGFNPARRAGESVGALHITFGFAF